MTGHTERESLLSASAFSDSADREFVWETIRECVTDHPRGESALQALDRILDRYDEAKDAESSRSSWEVLPRMIVEAAQDFHTSYMDGRQPTLSEEGLRERLDRIVLEKFPAKDES